MKITSLDIENFTSLKKVYLSNLPNLAVFIGKNSSGKSNLIDALTLLFTQFGSLNLGSANDYQHLFFNHYTQAGTPPKIAVNLTLTSKEWAKLLSANQSNGSGFEQYHLYLEKQLVTDNGVVQWNTNTIRIGEVPVVVNGEVVTQSTSPEPDAIPGDIPDIIAISVESGEFFNRLGPVHTNGAEYVIIHG